MALTDGPIANGKRKGRANATLSAALRADGELAALSPRDMEARTKEVFIHAKSSQILDALATKGFDARTSGVGEKSHPVTICDPNHVV